MLTFWSLIRIMPPRAAERGRMDPRMMIEFQQASAVVNNGLPWAYWAAALIFAAGAVIAMADGLLGLRPPRNSPRVERLLRRPQPSLARFVICASCKRPATDGHGPGCRYYPGWWKTYIPPALALAGLTMVAIIYGRG